MKHRGARIHSRFEDILVAPLTAVSTGFVGSTYAGGFNQHVATGGDIDSLFTTPGADLGIKTFRDSIIWNRVEQSSGVLSWTHAAVTSLESIIDAMALIGIRPIVILGIPDGLTGVTPPFSHLAPWADPATPPTDYQDYLTYVVTRLGSRCNDYDIYNEPNFGYTTPGTGRISAQQYAWMLQNSYAKIKAANPSATVWANMLDPNSYTAYLVAVMDFGGFNYIDGFLFHGYEGGGEHSLTKTAEYVRKKCANTVGVVRGTYSSMRLGIGECGWGTDTITTDLVGRNLARQAFMFRALGMEHHNVYSVYEYNGGLGLYSGVGVRKHEADYYANAIAICQDATAARYYQDLPVHQVSLLTSSGNRKLAIWGNTSTGLTGDTAATTDASGNKSVWVRNLGGVGTLVSTSMEDGSTTSQTLDLGTHQYTIAYSPIAHVLSSTQVIQFPECPV